MITCECNRRYSKGKLLTDTKWILRWQMEQYKHFKVWVVSSNKWLSPRWDEGSAFGTQGQQSPHKSQQQMTTLCYGVSRCPSFTCGFEGFSLCFPIRAFTISDIPAKTQVGQWEVTKVIQKWVVICGFVFYILLKSNFRDSSTICDGRFLFKRHQHVIMAADSFCPWHLCKKK